MPMESLEDEGVDGLGWDALTALLMLGEEEKKEGKHEEKHIRQCALG